MIKWCFDEFQEDPNPLLDARLLLDDYIEDDDEEEDNQVEHVGNTNSLLDARLLFDEDLLNLL